MAVSTLTVPVWAHLKMLTPLPKYKMVIDSSKDRKMWLYFFIEDAKIVTFPDITDNYVEILNMFNYKLLN